LDSDSDEEDLEPEANFETIIGEMVGTGYAEGHPTEAISLEIKSFKFAQNKVQLLSHDVFHSPCLRNILTVSVAWFPLSCSS
jgi:hypothetical protein